MSKFNRGDRVRWAEDAMPGRIWTVAADSQFIDDVYLIEWQDENGAAFCGMAGDLSLRHVIDPPAPVTPWHRFTLNGNFTGRHKTFDDALEHVTEGQFILRITTGDWYDHEGNPIS